MEPARDLQKLEQLHMNEAFSEEELAKAAEARRQCELDRIDREWEIERQQYLVTDRQGQRHVPTVRWGLAVAFVGFLVGIIWGAIGIDLAVHGPDSGLVAVLLFAFGSIGNIIIVASLGWVVYCIKRVQKYEMAFLEYKQRRGNVNSQQVQG